MSAWPDALAQVDLRLEARRVAARFGVALHLARGPAGALRGRGAGASVEVEDHRPFVPGDDPRHVDWNAFGRTGQWVAKTFRAEIAPAVDLVFDASRSMAVFPAKRDRAIELLFFALEGARRAGAQTRLHVLTGEAYAGPSIAEVDAGAWLPPTASEGGAQAPALGRLRWRANALRVLVSDLLFPGSPRAVLGPVLRGAGRVAVLAPYLPEERTPAWRGNLTLVDAETGARRAERLDAAARGRLAEAYDRHFSAYAEAAPRLGVSFARVSSAGALEEALLAEAVPRGVLVPWS